MLRFAATLALFLCVSLSASAQEHTVVPITKLQIYGVINTAKFGTGFCMDAECRYIGTNYHVAKAMGKHFSVEGDPVVTVWLATGPNDEEASTNKMAGLMGRLIPGEKYTQVRDFALIELRYPLSKKGYQGMPFYNDNELQEGQEVTIYSYPLHWNPKRSLESFKATFAGYNIKYSTHDREDLSDKTLVFKYDSADGKITGGASGGLVVDSQGRIVGVLNALAKNLDHTVTAVPIPSVSAFVSRVQPYLSAQIFPKSVFIPPVVADYYPEWVPTPPTGELQRRIPEPPDVQMLRTKAQDVVDNSYTLISVESFEWGKDSAENPPQAVAYYEVRMLDGYQHFREYPDGKKEMDSVPWPVLNNVIAPGDAWFSTPEMVAKDFNLKIRQKDDIDVQGQKLHVFQFFGAKEDKVCNFDDQDDLGFLTIHHIHTYDCYGEVWTDQDENIIRMSLNFHMLDSWSEWHEIVTFGWVEIEGEKSLVPITISSQAEKNSHVHWCRGAFTNYQQFRVKARMIPGVPQK